MPRQRTPWFRFYTEAVYNRKIMALKPPLFRWWVLVLGQANVGKPRGRLPCRDDLCYALRLSPAQVTAVLLELRAAGLLDVKEDCYWAHNWADWQYLSDANLTPGRAEGRAMRPGSARRMHGESTADARRNDGESTADARRIRRADTAGRSETETETETETEREARARPKKSRPRPLSEIDAGMLAQNADEHPLLNVPREFEKFGNDLKRKGKTWADHVAAWRQWLIHAEEFRERDEKTGRLPAGAGASGPGDKYGQAGTERAKARLGI